MASKFNGPCKNIFIPSLTPKCFTYPFHNVGISKSNISSFKSLNIGFRPEISLLSPSASAARVNTFNSKTTWVAMLNLEQRVNKCVDFSLLSKPTHYYDFPQSEAR